MNALGLLAIPAILLFVGYFYYTLVGTTRLSLSRLWLMPAILGFFALANAPADLGTSGSTLLATLVSVALGAAVGFAQGWSMTIYRETDGTLWQKGSVTSALIVLGSLPLRFGLRYLLNGGVGYLVYGGLGFTAGGRDTLFPYLAMGLALVLARAAAIVLRNPMVREAIS